MWKLVSVLLRALTPSHQTPEGLTGMSHTLSPASLLNLTAAIVAEWKPITASRFNIWGEDDSKARKKLAVMAAH